MTRRRSTLPKSRNPPQVIEPTPPEPPATKPAIEAVPRVDGNIRNSCPDASAALSTSMRTAPGSLTTRPRSIDRILFISARFMSTPPMSGIAWP